MSWFFYVKCFVLTILILTILFYLAKELRILYPHYIQTLLKSIGTFLELLSTTAQIFVAIGTLNFEISNQKEDCNLYRTAPNLTELHSA